MFCYNCGAQIPEDAAFCGVCGSKISREDNQATDQQAETNEEIEKTENNAPSKAPKRKLKKLPLILGIAVLAVIAVIVVAVNWTGKVDYAATAGAHAPLAGSLPYTYKEVLEKYMDSPEWTVREEGDEHYVDISGTTKGTGHHLTVTIKVTPDPDDSDRASITAEKVKYDEIESASSQEAVYFLSNLFYAYDAGYEDLAEFGLFDELSAVYTNEVEGISFQYPDTWTDKTADSAQDGGYVVSLWHVAERDAMLSYGMEIRKFPDSQNLIDNMFIDDEEFAASFMNGENELSVLNTEMGELSGVPARLIEYVGADGVYYKSYIYGVHSTLYWVDFMCMENQMQIFDGLFDDMISSYTITSDSLTDELCFMGIPVSELLDYSAADVVSQFGYGYYAYENGRISYDEIEFNMWDDETVDSIIINNHEELSINGTGLTADSNGVIYSENVAEWFGYNYSDERNEYGECSMTYYYPAYSVSFTYNKFYEVYLIDIRSRYSGQDDNFDY